MGRFPDALARLFTRWCCPCFGRRLHCRAEGMLSRRTLSRRSGYDLQRIFYLDPRIDDIPARGLAVPRVQRESSGGGRRGNGCDAQRFRRQTRARRSYGSNAGRRVRDGRGLWNVHAGRDHPGQVRCPGIKGGVLRHAGHRPLLLRPRSRLRAWADA